MKLRKNPNGYLKTNISICGKLKTVFIHRVVAELFIPNPNNLPIVNHIDGNKENNIVTNLEWCTYKYNSNHAKKLGLLYYSQGTQCVQSKLTKEDVLYIRNICAPNQKLEQGIITKISKQFNVSRPTIRNVIDYITYKNI